MKRHLPWVLIFIACGHAAIGQIQDTNLLQEVPLFGDKIHLSTDDNGFSISEKPVNPYSSLDGALYSNHTTHVKTYGPGQTATFSSRGATSNQVGVFWNDLPISSPSLGVTDVSLISVDLFSISQYTGSHSAIEGSQAMGSALVLGQSKAKNFLSLQWNSMNNYTGLGTFQYSLGKGKGTTQFSIQDHKNEFQYTYRNEEKTRENASSKVYNLIQSYEVNHSKGKFNIGLWYTNALRENPNSIIASSNNPSSLFDDQLKIALGTSYKLSLGELKLTFGGQYQQQRFVDLFKISNDTNRTINSQVSAAWKVDLAPKLSFHSEVKHLYSSTFGSATRKENQHNFALQYGVNYHSENTKALLIIRHEVIDSTFVPIIPSFSFSQKLIAAIHAVGKVGYQFRYPTLNDRFWSVGGNPDLKPESGFFYEAGLLFKKEYFTLRSVYFFSQVENTIIWVPGPQGIWSPNNIKKTESLGVENTLYGKFSISKIKVDYFGGYTYNRSVVTESNLPNDQSLDKQIIYTPVHKGNIGMTLGYSIFQLGTQFTITSKTFANSDHRPSSQIDGFYTTDIFFRTTLPISKTNISLEFGINNLLDQEYETIKYYPLPGRNYNLKISYNF